MEVKFSNNGDMDIVEISRPDGSVVALPAEQINAETGYRYCDMFFAQYAEFKHPSEKEEEAVAEREPVAEPPADETKEPA